MNYAILALIGLTAGIYSIVASIRCGIALVLTKPALSLDNSTKHNKSNRAGTFNKLLLVFLMFLFILKNNAVHLNQANTLNFFASLVIICTLALYILETYFRPRSKGALNSYLVLSFLGPLSLVAIGVYLLTAQQFWQSFIGGTLFVSSIFGLVLIGLSSLNTKPKIYENINFRYASQIIFGVWVLLLGFFVPLGFQRYNSSLINPALSVVSVVVIVSTISYGVVSIYQKKYQELFQYAIVIGIAVPLLLALNNNPYFISSKLMAKDYFVYQTNTYYNNLLNTLCYIVLFALLVSSVYVVLGFFRVSLRKSFKLKQATK